MLPDIRLVLGTMLASIVLAIGIFGAVAAVRIAHQAGIGSVEASRSLAFTAREPGAWRGGRSDPFARIPAAASWNGDSSAARRRKPHNCPQAGKNWCFNVHSDRGLRL